MKTLSVFLARALAILVLLGGVCGAATTTIIYRFPTGGSLGFGANGPLVTDGAGSFFGTTANNIFELTLEPGGVWKETVLYDAGPGYNFSTFGLARDPAGNLYGVRASGGNGSNPHCMGSCGLAFELAKGPNGTWTYSVIHDFNYVDGTHPSGVLTLDAAGNLYGTTSGGPGFSECPQGCGLVFELSKDANGVWSESILHVFQPQSDGGVPLGGVIFDASGTVLYGTTLQGGGFSNSGTVYKMVRTGATWKETVIHRFRPDLNGSQPRSGLVMDSSGNLYGTTWGHTASYPYSNAFRLSFSNGTWKETVLYTFGPPNIKAGDVHGLLLDNAGNLYGTTDDTVFKLSPTASGPWTGKALSSHYQSQQPLSWNAKHTALLGEAPLLGTSGMIYKVALP